MTAATMMLDRNDTVKTRSSKIPSRTARRPPNTASRAATTAMGRYGCSHNGTVGSRYRPAMTPTSRPIAAITGRPPGWAGRYRRRPTEPHQDRLPRVGDRGTGGGALAVHGHRLGTGRPQPVDHRLEVAVEHTPL